MPEIKISSLETPQAPKPTKAGQVIRRDRIAGRFSYRAVFRPDDASRRPRHPFQDLAQLLTLMAVYQFKC